MPAALISFRPERVQAVEALESVAAKTRPTLPEASISRPQKGAKRTLAYVLYRHVVSPWPSNIPLALRMSRSNPRGVAQVPRVRTSSPNVAAITRNIPASYSEQMMGDA